MAWAIRNTIVEDMTGPSNGFAIRTDRVSRHYQMGDALVRAVDDVSIAVQPAEFVALLGSSGSGKSTLLNLLAGLDRPTCGAIYAHEKNLAAMNSEELADHRSHTVGMVFQAFNLIGDLTVYENVELPLTYRGTSSAERKQKVEHALQRVGMAHRVRHYPSQLSGGQQQRVAVARALVGDPLILMADEPTGNLDSKNGEAVMELLRDLHRNGATICMVTHDERYLHFAERTIRLFDGRIVEETKEAGVAV